MKICPNGHKVSDNAQFCPTCGANLLNSSRNKYCKKCGKERSGNERYCLNCGSPFETHVSVPTSNNKNTYLFTILIAAFAVVICGYYGYTIFSKSDEIKISSGTEETVSKRLNALLSQLVGETDADKDQELVNKFFTEEYKTDFYRKCKKADKESYEHPRIWWQFSDCDPEKFDIKDFKLTSSDVAKAKVRLTSELYIGEFDIVLRNENSIWLIDNIIEIETINNPDFDISEESEDYDYITTGNSNNHSLSTPKVSSSKSFANEQYVTMYLANQSFRSNDGFTIRYDGDLRMYAEGDYVGVVSVLRYNSTSALLRYGGGAYGEGKITVQIIGDRLQLIDPTDGSVYHQR